MSLKKIMHFGHIVTIIIYLSSCKTAERVALKDERYFEQVADFLDYELERKSIDLPDKFRKYGASFELYNKILNREKFDIVQYVDSLKGFKQSKNSFISTVDAAIEKSTTPDELINLLNQIKPESKQQKNALYAGKAYCTMLSKKIAKKTRPCRCEPKYGPGLKCEWKCWMKCTVGIVISTGSVVFASASGGALLVVVLAGIRDSIEACDRSK